MADTAAMLVAYEAEITRLRAALADAQAVGFSAGVEAAKSFLLDAREISDDDEEVSPSGETFLTLIASLPTAIRALTPPDATAAAARVLLGDDIQIARMAGAVHDGPLGADDYWFSAATESGAWCVDAVRVALRAIAGDTP